MIADAGPPSPPPELLARALYDLSGDPVYVIDEETGRFLDANPAALRMLGYTVEELRRLSPRDLHPPEDGRILRDTLSRLDAEGSVRVAGVHHRGRDGRLIPVEVHVRRLTGEGRRLSVAVARETSVRLEQQERVDSATAELSRTRELLEHLYGSASDAIALVDLDGIIRVANPRMADLCGVPPGRLPGRSFREAAPREIVPECEARLAEVARRGEVRFRLGWPVAGLRRDLDVWAMRIELGGAPFVLGVARDVTELTRRTQELAETKEFLELLQQQASDAFVLMSEDGLIRSVNARAVDLSGIPAAASVGRHFTDFVPEDRRAELREAFAETLRGRVLRLRSEIVRGDGTRLAVDVTGTSIVRDGRRYVSAILRDASEQVERESRLERRSRELAQSKEFLERLQESASDGLVLVDPDGVIVSVNRAMCEIMARPRERFVGRHYAEVSSPERLQEFAARHADILAGRPVTLRARERRDDGREVILDVSSSAMPWEGRMYGLSLVRDVTSLVRAEERLAGEKEIFERIARGAPLAGTLEVLCRILSGQCGGAPVSLHLREGGGRLAFGASWGLPDDFRHVAPDDPGGSCARAAARKQPAECEDLAGDPSMAFLRDVAGRLGLRRCRSTPILSTAGDVLGTIAVYLQRSEPMEPGELEAIDRATPLAAIAIERARAEADLRRSEAKFRAVVENSIDAIYIKDLEGRYLLMNPTAAAVVGRRADEVVGLTDPELFPEAEARLIREHDRRVREARRPLTDETELRTPSGTIYFHTIKCPWMGPDGEVIGIIGVSRNMTERRAAEERTHEAAESRRRALSQLKRAQAQLVLTEKLASVGMLVAGVAHQINNPINVIYGNLSLLKDRFEELRRQASAGRRADWARTGAMIADAMKAAREAREVLTTFRDFARESRAGDLVDLAAVARSAAAAVRPRRRGIRVVLDLAAVPEVRGFESQLRQAVLNLIRNALDAMGSKGTLTLRTSAGRGRVVLDVIDTGPGIPARLRRRIFEPFFTTKAEGRGMGLGLTIAANIVEQHGGRLSLPRKRRSGGHVRISLPRGDR